MASLSHTWGTESHERRLAFPCDHFIAYPDEAVYRGVSIHASPDVIFRWLCQMRIAPYSYDWIDNSGRQSPSQLTPGLDALVIGQDVMTVFELVDFAHNQHLTIRIRHDTRAARVYGDVAVSYLIMPKSVRNCRLLVKIVVQYPRGAYGWLARIFLPWGDLVMMRRQLLNFKALAEQIAEGV